MPKRKIKFMDLLSPHSMNISIKLQLLEYVFKNKPKSIQTGWYRSGFDKLIYGYSANDHKSHTAIRDNEHLELILYRLLFSEHSGKECLKFREDLGLNNGHKFFDLDLKNNNLQFGRWGFFSVLQKLKGRALKKEFFHPDYPKRTEPTIISIKFTVSESGYHIFFDFTFTETQGSCWGKEYWSNGKSLPLFLLEAFEDIDKRLVEPFVNIFKCLELRNVRNRNRNISNANICKVKIKYEKGAI